MNKTMEVYHTTPAEPHELSIAIADLILDQECRRVYLDYLHRHTGHVSATEEELAQAS